ncbi:SGNH/GDSL hydrolase family protein [Lacticaseibacillus mingshuiensis]|uniref:SGNH/GDSL hydrolase family protein n=1 Tax=Lacticaseibacillus mingshuiensis TaxID=2799574 RepID=UPI001950280C|nr:SGNH/GDSL hydrolase family protein [Lacticaseibacillus mingshuiensis]
MKRLITFGDSVTWYDRQRYLATTHTPGQRCVGYQQVLRATFGVPVRNEGVSGETLQQIVQRVATFAFRPGDVLVLFGGINNFNKEALSQIGSPSTLAPETFTGATRHCLTQLAQTHPSMPVLLVAPYPVYKREKGWSAGAYRERILALGREFDRPVCDLWALDVKADVTRFFADDVAQTGFLFHPTDWGHRLIGRQLADALAQLN